VALSITGSLDVGIGGSSGELSCGIQSGGGIALEFLKAFTVGAGEPTVGAALGKLISDYVIPADPAGLQLLQVNDVATVSGRGSLTISANFDVTAPVNPLASVNLPLGTGTLAVQDGVMIGLGATLGICGSYQVRVRKLDSNTVELGYCKQRGSTLKADLSASTGVQVKLGETELVGKLINAINSDADENQRLFDGGLTEDEAATLESAIKSGIDRSLQASLDLVLSTLADNEAAFLYQIRLDQLDTHSRAAIRGALRGDLSKLTQMESDMRPDGTIAAGIKVLKSRIVEMRKNEMSLKVNLLGLVNFVSLSDLIHKSEIITDPVTGDLTISETISGTSISAISDPLKRQEALRKAMFDSVLVTAAYRAGKTTAMPALKSHNVHFAFTENTSRQTVGNYLNWFVALRLLDGAGKKQLVDGFAEGGTSTCLLRTEFDDQASTAMFFDSQGQPRPKSDYLEIGRKALASLLDPLSSGVDKYRYELLTDIPRWGQAVVMGPVDDVGSLLPISSTNFMYRLVLQCVEGDIYDIAWWSSSMQATAQKLHDMRQFLTTANPATLAENSEFSARRTDLGKHLAGVVARSKVRFDQPWGLVALFLAAGAPNASGRLLTTTLSVQKFLDPVAIKMSGA
jgi:hypothetical protein